MSSTLETLVATSRAACRRARLELDEAADALDRAGLPALERRVSNVIVALGLAEDAELEAHARALSGALEQLSAVLVTLQSSPMTNHLERATERVARTMATLHPLRRGLEELGASGSTASEAPAPLPLVQKKKKVLEIVPDADAPESTPSLRAQSARAPSERRMRAREALEVDIGFHSETNFFAGFGDDLSEGGLFIATYDILPIGRELTLSFVLPDGSQITVGGRVAWIREPADLDAELHPGMGVEFTEIDNEAIAAIQRYMRARAPIFFDR